MNELLSLAAECLVLVLRLSIPILGVALVVGLAVGIVQSVTQIQDQTLAYVPRLIAILLALWWFGPGMMRDVVRFNEKVMARAARVSSLFPGS